MASLTEKPASQCSCIMGLLHNFLRSEANDHFRPFLGSFAANSGDYLTKMHVKMGKISVAAVAQQVMQQAHAVYTPLAR